MDGTLTLQFIISLSLPLIAVIAARLIHCLRAAPSFGCFQSVGTPFNQPQSGTLLRVSSFGNFITFRLPSFQSTCRLP